MAAKSKEKGAVDMFEKVGKLLNSLRKQYIGIQISDNRIMASNISGLYLDEPLFDVISTDKEIDIKDIWKSPDYINSIINFCLKKIGKDTINTYAVLIIPSHLTEDERNKLILEINKIKNENVSVLLLRDVDLIASSLGINKNLIKKFFIYSTDRDLYINLFWGGISISSLKVSTADEFNKKALGDAYNKIISKLPKELPDKIFSKKQLSNKKVSDELKNSWKQETDSTIYAFVSDDFKAKLGDKLLEHEISYFDYDKLLLINEVQRVLKNIKDNSVRRVK